MTVLSHVRSGSGICSLFYINDAIVSEESIFRINKACAIGHIHTCCVIFAAEFLFLATGKKMCDIGLEQTISDESGLSEESQTSELNKGNGLSQAEIGWGKHFGKGL